MGRLSLSLLGLFRKDKELPYDEELKNRIQPLYEKLTDHYSERSGRQSYIIRDFDDLTEVDKYMAYTNNLLHHTLGTFMSKKMRKYGKDFKGVVYCSIGYQDHFWFCLNDEESDSKLSGRYLYSTVHDMAKVKESELYKGYLTIKQISKHLDSIKENKELLNYVDTILSDVGVADYVNKLKRIGEDEEVIKALMRRDDEYIKMLFEPLKLILEQIETKKEDIEEYKLSQNHSVVVH